MVKNRLYITKETHIPPSDYENWAFYEYEFLLEDLKEYIENENKKNEEENKKYSSSNYASQMNSQMKSMSKDFKLPSTPKF